MENPGPWFHGVLSAREADSRLIEQGAADGCFLIRISEKEQTVYVLSVCRNGRVSHHPISVSRNGDRTLFSFSRGTDPGIKLSSLDQLISIYQDEKMGEPGPLTEYVPAPSGDGDGGNGAAAISDQDNLFPFGQPPVAEDPETQQTTSTRQKDRELLNAEQEELLQEMQAEMQGVDLNGGGNTGGALPAQKRATNPFLGSPSPEPSVESIVGQQQAIGDDDDVWYCTACTFANHSVLPVCEMCEAPRAKTATPNDDDKASDTSSVAPNPFVDEANPFGEPPKIEPTASKGPKRSNPFSAGGDATGAGNNMQRGQQRQQQQQQQQQRQQQPGARGPGGRVMSVSGAPGAARNHPPQGGQQQGARRATTSGRPQDQREQLLCEGSLAKIRGTMQNRSRWFMMTSKKLMYYTANGGQLMSSVLLKNIVAVTEVGEKRFRLSTAEPFGKSGTHEMVLEAPTVQVKQKWLRAMKNKDRRIDGFSSDRAELITECYLIKVQPFGVANTTRWFRLTTKKFAYYSNEAGEELGSVPFEYIAAVTVMGKKDFVVTAVQPFTKSGNFEVVCRCQSPEVRSKWMSGLKRVLPQSKFFHKRN